MKRNRQQAVSTSKVVGYTRVSTAEQALEGVSLDGQAAAIRAYCMMRGLELVDLVQDPGASAGKPLEKRDGGKRVLSLVEQGEAGGVVAWKLDRLFRDCAECLTVTGDWDRSTVSLHLVDLGGQAIDTSTAMGRFFLTVMAGAAEMERNLIRERTSAGMAYKKAQGERVGRIPFGYRLADDGVHLEPDAEEQATLATMVQLRRAGKTLQQITDQLNETGRPSRNRRGEPGRWSVSGVWGLLKRDLQDADGKEVTDTNTDES